MYDALLVLYVVNSVFLIIHEIESAYWKEWELFKLPGDLTGFLLVHIPLLLVVFAGLVALVKLAAAGLIISIAVSLSGMFAFGIHSWFIHIGKPGFSLVISRIILRTVLVLSFVQLIVSVFLLSIQL